MAKKSLNSDESEAKQNSKSSTKVVTSYSNWFDLERSYIIFALLYFPIVVLFINQGLIEKLILVIYTILLGFVGAVLLIKFIMFLVSSANEHKNNYGSILGMYVFDALMPLLMFKVLGYVIVQMLPKTHSGLLCDLVNFIKDLYYYVFAYQQTLTVVIAASFVSVAALALWSVGRGSK